MSHGSKRYKVAPTRVLVRDRWRGGFKSVRAVRVTRGNVARWYGLRGRVA